MTQFNHHWIAPVTCTIPDFIICGAMKCGTTTLHAILNRHPDVFVPQKEVNFFDMDDIFQHPDFNLYHKKKWKEQDFEGDPAKYWQWYASQFVGVKKGQCIGEDSTTYIASENAIKRISQQNKKIKVIVMLRNPVSRAYSHYGHLLRTGRAINSFEATLQYNPYSILNRSMYVQQLKNIYKNFPKEQVKVIIFEDFIKDVKAGTDDVCKFLGVDHSKLCSEAYELHENIARTPRFPKLQVFKNRCIPSLGYKQYQNYFEIEPKIQTTPLSFNKVIEFLHRKINPLIVRKSPPMAVDTKRYLEGFFKRELKDLDNILEENVLSKWFDR